MRRILMTVLLTAAGLLLVILVAVVGSACRGDSSEGSSTATNAGGIKIVRAYIVDPDDPDPANRVREPIDLNAHEDDQEVTRVYDSGGSALGLELEKSGEPFEGEVTIEHSVLAPDGSVVATSQKATADEDGKVGFLLELISGTKLTGDPGLAKPFIVKVSTDKGLVQDLPLHVIDLLGPGSLTSDLIEDEDELMTELQIDPLLIGAVEQFCGFPVSEISHPVLRLNDKPRHQVALVNGVLMEARSVIPAGQVIWVIVSKGGQECFINPPCGNPEAPVGKLPPQPAPPIEEVVPPPPLPPEVVLPPSATNTPGPTATQVPPTSTPKTRTATPRTPTPPPPTATSRAPDFLVQVQGPNVGVCEAGQTQVSANAKVVVFDGSTTDLAPFTYQWYVDGPSKGTGSPVHFTVGPGWHNVWVVATDRFGRTRESSHVSFYAESSVSPDPGGPSPMPAPTRRPAATPTSNPDDGCVGGCN